MREFGRVLTSLFAVTFAALFISGCTSSRKTVTAVSGCEYASYFDLSEDEYGNELVITIDPKTLSRDTLTVTKPYHRIVCMSSSFVSALSSVGMDSVVVGVSGLSYLTNTCVKSSAKEVGYESALDYETILSLNPDLIVSYSTNGVAPQYVTRLRDMGQTVILVNDYLEDHPLARAEYVRLFACLVGKRDAADSFFQMVKSNYNELCDFARDAKLQKVLINIPYSDQWFVPGGDNYTSRLISDAGGEILGSTKGQSESSVISIEQAFILSNEADFWLHPGWCSTVKDLKSVNPLFEEFPVIGKRIYNNTLRTNSEGGNDFWETGAMRPDLILSDLISILHPELRNEPLHFYVEVR